MTRDELGKMIIESEKMLYRISKTILLSDDMCADAISETIVKAFSKISTLKNDNYARTWLTRILINECYNIHRARQREVSYEEYQDNNPEPEYRDTIYPDLYEALTKLKEKDRLCVTLYYLEGYNIRETALLSGLTESAVKQRLAKARKTLKADIDGGIAL